MLQHYGLPNQAACGAWRTLEQLASFHRVLVQQTNDTEVKVVTTLL
ncbi:MAG TPA: hypothetical protein VGH53_14110 [Streptosporangiaceae bacterium]|jgi:hypothetical protein